ncbi:fra a 1-associated protein-like [Zingiber officinale]|uniref:fra a 1-associated protein-like n=1 Tax=Zingiber officinale TaxID=94328 RepID=UPI001C4C428A|nr:fra a 1-associated protein-like [Zingiber officinale]
MGWKREDDELSGRGFGDLANRPNSNPNFPRSAEGGDRFSTRRVVRSNCRTEEVEPGRFVRKCEKTEQLLRDCVGRPPQVVESNTEYTEVDVTEDMNKGHIPFDPPSAEPFTFPGLQNDINSIERTLFGGFRHFLEAAEEMTNEFFRSMGDPLQRRSEPAPFGHSRPADEQLKNDHPTQPSKSDFSGYSGQMTDV